MVWAIDLYDQPFESLVLAFVPLINDAAYRSGLHGRPDTRCLLIAEPVPCWIP